MPPQDHDKRLRRRSLLGLMGAGMAGATLVPAVRAFAETPIFRSGTREAFDTVDLTFNDGEAVSHETNEGGLLSWQQSNVLISYVMMYRAHRDPYYLDKFIHQADRVLAHRDSERGVTDYLGRSLPAWRNFNVTVDQIEPMIVGVDTGNITYPMTVFVRTVQATPALMSLPKYRGAAARYLTAAEDAFAVHEEEYDRRKGSYFFPKGSPYVVDGIEYPANMNRAIGRTAANLWFITGGPRYRRRMLDMVRRWQHDFYPLDDGALAWPHQHKGSWTYRGWSEEDGVSVNMPSYNPNQRVSDIGHGVLDVSFAEVSTHDRGLHQQTLTKMARTMTRHTVTTDANADLTVHRLIDGKQDDAGAPRQERHMAGWLPLAPYAEDDLFSIAGELLDQNLDDIPEGGDMSRHDGTAYLNFMTENGVVPVSEYLDTPPA